MMANIYATLMLYQVLGLSTFHVLTHFILTTTHLSSYYYYPCITDEETEISNLPKITELSVQKSSAIWFQILHSHSITLDTTVRRHKISL